MRWWQNLSVSKKLYSVVGVMALLIAAELGTLLFAMTTLSAVRAFVGSEGMWSKAQKNAVHNLQLDAMTRDEFYYRLFPEQLAVPMGHRKARSELMKQDPDYSIIEEGFREGQNHPSDIRPMTNLVRRFHKVPQLARAIEKWQEGDTLLSELIVLAERLYTEDSKGTAGNERNIDRIVSQIMVLDEKLSDAENQFSTSWRSLAVA